MSHYKCSGVFPHEVKQPCSYCFALEQKRMHIHRQALEADNRRLQFELEEVARKKKENTFRAYCATLLETLGLCLTRLAAQLKG